jgi:hypothetical protein
MTAVEWLAEQIKEYDFAPITNTDEYAIVIPVWIFKDKLNQAKEMEKEQIIEAYGVGADCDNEWAKDYYNEKYIK